MGVFRNFLGGDVVISNIWDLRRKSKHEAS